MIDGFGLLVGHMVGDYVLQNDWMAGNKANPHPGPKPGPIPDAPVFGSGTVGLIGHTGQIIDGVKEWCDYNERRAAWRRGHLACTVHCLLYTLAVWLFSYEWMPWWGLVACFLAHWPVDRFALAGRWMRNCSGQKFFASKDHPMWPNGVVLVDNTFHLVVLYVIAKLAGL